MNNKWNRFLILYLLYYKHYTGKPGFHDTNAIIQEDDLQLPQADSTFSLFFLNLYFKY